MRQEWGDITYADMLGKMAHRCLLQAQIKRRHVGSDSLPQYFATRTEITNRGGFLMVPVGNRSPGQPTIWILMTTVIN